MTFAPSPATVPANTVTISPATATAKRKLSKSAGKLNLNQNQTKTAKKGNVFRSDGKISFTILKNLSFLGPTKILKTSWYLKKKSSFYYFLVFVLFFNFRWYTNS